MLPTNIRLPASTHMKLKRMSLKSNMGKTLTNLIKEYDGAPLVPEGHKFTGLNLDDSTIHALDAIVKQNNLKSRNQALELLIESEWPKHVLGEQTEV